MNKKAVVRPDRLLFLHIPKAAGSTLHSVVSRQFKRSQQLLYHEARDPQKLSTLPLQQLNDLRLLRGHFTYGCHERLAQGTFEYFTMLRDPVDRIISLYRYILRNPNTPLYNKWVKNKYTLTELMESKEFPVVNDSMVRMLTGDFETPYGCITEEHLEKAFSNIDRHFPLIGIQERFDEFVLELGDRYGWRFLVYRSHRVADRNKKSISVERNDQLIEAIKKYNRMDQLLYEEIKRRKEIYYESLGTGFASRVVRFKKINAIAERAVSLMPFILKLFRT